MENLRITLNKVDGSAIDIVRDGETGRELIEALLGDDFGAPPNVLVIEATTEDGTKVRINIPYDEQTTAFVSVSPPA